MRIMFSGLATRVQMICLHKEQVVSAIAIKRAKALKLLGPGASAVGIGGAPSITLAAEAAALSLVTGILAGAAAKQGTDLLKIVKNDTEYMLSNDGFYFPISDIKNIHLPYPASWYTEYNGERYIHSGEDFVWIRTEQGKIAVRWSSVQAMLPDE